MSLLQIDRLTKNFGGLTAVNGVSFRVEPGTSWPHRAERLRKSTTINVLTGVYRSSAGKSRSTARRDEPSPHVMIARGMARTFQGNRVFSKLSVLENVVRGMHCRTRSGLFGAIVRPPSARKEMRESHDKALASWRASASPLEGRCRSPRSPTVTRADGDRYRAGEQAQAPAPRRPMRE